MADYITLLGAEEVRRAGTDMRVAAEIISNAISQQQQTVYQHQQFLTEWLDRYEALQQRASAPETERERE